MLYEALFQGLHAARLRYLLVGAVAINLHGVPRMTADLDLMVDMAESNLRLFIQTMGTLGYKPRVPVAPEDILDPARRREWITWLHSERLYEEVDMFLENPIDFGPAYARRKDLPIGAFTVPLAGVEDLVALKSLAGREQDLSDIEALRKVQRLNEKGGE